MLKISSLTWLALGKPKEITVSALKGLGKFWLKEKFLGIPAELPRSSLTSKFPGGQYTGVISAAVVVVKDCPCPLGHITESMGLLTEGSQVGPVLKYKEKKVCVPGAKESNQTENTPTLPVSLTTMVSLMSRPEISGWNR